HSIYLADHDDDIPIKHDYYYDYDDSNDYHHYDARSNHGPAVALHRADDRQGGTPHHFNYYDHDGTGHHHSVAGSVALPDEDRCPRPCIYATDAPIGDEISRKVALTSLPTVTASDN